MTKKNVALIGAGRWGKNLARNFHALGVLHTICDSNEALLDQYRDAFSDVNLSANFNSVLENPLLTSVVIAAPAILHYTLAKQVLLADKDVYVEKPLCLDNTEGEELVALAEARGKVLMVGHLLQYHPYVVHLHEMLREGKIGKLQYIVSNRLALGPIRSEENALWNFAPHDVSVILSLCGNKLPFEVRCTGGAYATQGVEDITLTTLSFDENIKAHIHVSWLHPFKEQKLVVVGTSGMAVFDDTKPWNEKLLFCKNEIERIDGNPQIQAGEMEYIQIPQQEPLKLECQHFIDCCRERFTPRTDGQEGLRVLKVLHAAQESLNAQKDLVMS